MSVDGPATSSLRVPSGRVDDVLGLPTEDCNLLRRQSGDGPPPGNGGEGALARAAALRFPDLRELHGRGKVDALIDHITETAILRGELEEARLAAHVNLRDALAEMARLPASISKSKQVVDAARRASRPDLAERIDGARWLVERCTEQINRMGGCEYDSASRAYTILS